MAAEQDDTLKNLDVSEKEKHIWWGKKLTKPDNIVIPDILKDQIYPEEKKEAVVKPEAKGKEGKKGEEEPKEPPKPKPLTNEEKEKRLANAKSTKWIEAWTSSKGERQ